DPSRTRDERAVGAHVEGGEGNAISGVLGLFPEGNSVGADPGRAIQREAIEGSLRGRGHECLEAPRYSRRGSLVCAESIRCIPALVGRDGASRQECETATDRDRGNGRVVVDAKAVQGLFRVALAKGPLVP